jgi:hypothetical protein
MYYEFENTLTALYFKSLGAALEYAHKQGTRIVRYYS